MRIIRLPRYQRGSGIGGIFSKLLRFVTPIMKTAIKVGKPIAKRTLKELGKQGMTVAADTLGDVMAGRETVKGAVKKNAKRAMKKASKTVGANAKQIYDSTRNELKGKKSIKGVNMSGSGKKRKGRPKKRRNKRKNTIFD